MTREQLIKHWNVIEHFKNGGEVEVLIKGKCFTVEGQPFFSEKYYYRKKRVLNNL